MATNPTATTIRFSDAVYRRLDDAAATTGMPINSIVITACIDWLDTHAPTGQETFESVLGTPRQLPLLRPSRLARIARAISVRTVTPRSGTYPFERFTGPAKKMLAAATGRDCHAAPSGSCRLRDNQPGYPGRNAGQAPPGTLTHA